MYTILFIDEFENRETRLMDFIPRKDDIVPFFYTPYPTVKNVLLFPREDDTLAKMKLPENLDVIVTIGRN